MSDGRGNAEACVTEFGCEYVSSLSTQATCLLRSSCSHPYFRVVVSNFSRWPLHYACRTGNMKQVTYMIDKLGFDYDKINEADDHNATPLYHAALIGNTEICRFLLQRGAICTENDSARVFYVALTPSLRSMLREWSLSAASVDPYLQSLQQNFTVINSSGINSSTVIQDVNHFATDSISDLEPAIGSADCIIHIWNTHESSEHRLKAIYRSVAAHRIMVKYRCPFLFAKLEEIRNGDMKIHVLHLNGYSTAHCDAIVRFIEYLYIGKIEVMTLEMAFLLVQMANDWNVQCALCTKTQSKIDEYMLQIEQLKEKKNEFGNHINTVVVNSTKQSSWSRTTNPIVLASLVVDDSTDSTTTESLHNSNDHDYAFIKCTISDIDRLRSDMKQLAQLVSTPVRSAPPNKASPLTIPTTRLVNSCSDLTILCHAEIYHVHRFRFVQHSEYFSCALKGNFIESTTSTIDLSSMIPKNITITLPLIVQWMYADCFLHPSDVTIDVGIELLHICSALLCSPRLLSYVVNTIIVPNLSVDTVFKMLIFSRSFPGSIDRLETKCCEVIASNFEEIISNDTTAGEIQYIIVSEITATRQGGDKSTTDIPLVAEIRRAINRLVNITMVHRLQKLDLLKAYVEDISRDLQRDQESC